MAVEATVVVVWTNGAHWFTAVDGASDAGKVERWWTLRTTEHATALSTAAHSSTVPASSTTALPSVPTTTKATVFSSTKASTFTHVGRPSVHAAVRAVPSAVVSTHSTTTHTAAAHATTAHAPTERLRQNGRQGTAEEGDNKRKFHNTALFHRIS